MTRSFERVSHELVEFVHATQPIKKGESVRYPGEGTLLARRKNTQDGIPVDEIIWEKVLAL